MFAETFLILIAMFVAVTGPCVVLGVLGYAAIKALSRNPSAASKILMGLALILVFVEAISIVAILILFQLFSK